MGWHGISSSSYFVRCRCKLTRIARNVGTVESTTTFVYLYPLKVHFHEFSCGHFIFMPSAHIMIATIIINSTCFLVIYNLFVCSYILHGHNFRHKQNANFIYHLLIDWVEVWPFTIRIHHHNWTRYIRVYDVRKTSRRREKTEQWHTNITNSSFSSPRAASYESTVKQRNLNRSFVWAQEMWIVLLTFGLDKIKRIEQHDFGRGKSTFIPCQWHATVTVTLARTTNAGTRAFISHKTRSFVSDGIFLLYLSF